MINMNILFEFNDIKEPHVWNRFKIFLKMQVKFCLFFRLFEETNRLQIDAILDLKTFLVNGHLNFIYALSTCRVKIIIYQNFNVKVFFSEIPPINFKNTFDLLLVH